MNMRQDIDFVILWVDGSDPEWRAEKAKYNPDFKVSDGEERYREWGLMPFWFRSVEKFAPWVRKIHFVTWGHLPEWLNTEAPKLNIVRHEDYMPKEVLPVFNSHALEVGLHRIPGLSEKFVYFNDDTFLLNHVKPSDFFIGNKVVDMMAFRPVGANRVNPIQSIIHINNSLLLSKHFDKRANIKKQPYVYFKPGYPLKYWIYNFVELLFPLFTGFYSLHQPAPYFKRTFKKVWSKEGELLKEVQTHRFRDPSDVNQYIFREWQKLTGHVVPRNIQRYSRYFEIKEDDNTKLLKTIMRQNGKMLCINDTVIHNNISKTKKQLNRAFTSILPQKSAFEL